MSEDDRTTEVRWFPSKTDGWLLILLTLPPVSALAALVGAAQTGRWLSAVLPVATVLVVYFGLLFPTEYGIDASNLVIRAGLVRMRVPLSSIRTVKPTHSPWSAPALSLDRLEICWGDGRFDRTRILPREREQFLDVLARRSGLARDGGTLERPVT
jgi:hypothetical protein